MRMNFHLNSKALLYMYPFQEQGLRLWLRNSNKKKVENYITFFNDE
jgi:hypothetical protein